MLCIHIYSIFLFLNKRDKNMSICEICKKNVEVVEIHHIASKMCGGTNDKSNLCEICPTCHSLVHRQSLHNGINKKGRRIILEGRFDTTSGNILV